MQELKLGSLCGLRLEMMNMTVKHSPRGFNCYHFCLSLCMLGCGLRYARSALSGAESNRSSANWTACINVDLNFSQGTCDVSKTWGRLANNDHARINSVSHLAIDFIERTVRNQSLEQRPSLIC